MGKGGRSRAGGGGGGPLSAHCASCTFGWACCIFLVEGLIAVVRRLRDGIIALRDLERNYVTLGVQHVRPGRCCWCFFFFFRGDRGDGCTHMGYFLFLLFSDGRYVWLVRLISLLCVLFR